MSLCLTTGAPRTPSSWHIRQVSLNHASLWDSEAGIMGGNANEAKPSTSCSCFTATGAFPREEQYGLSAQMRRAAISIPSNIAEGFNRYNNKEYRQFLYVALGSCAELETQVELSGDLEYLGKAERDELLEQINFESRMLRNLIKKLEA